MVGLKVNATAPTQSKWGPDSKDGSAVRALFALPGVLGLIPYTHMVAYNHLLIPIPGDQIYMQGKTLIHIKIKTFKVKVGLRRAKKNIPLSPAYVDMITKFMGDNQIYFITGRVSQYSTKGKSTKY